MSTVLPRPMKLVRLARTLPVLLLTLLLGCAETPLSTRYNAEKKLYRARKTLQRVSNNPEAAGPLRDDAIGRFQSILSEYPLSRARGDAEEVHGLGMVRTAAAVHLSNLYRDGKERDKAIAVLRSIREETKSDPDLGLRVHTELIALLSRPLEPDSLVDVLRAAAEDLPAATSDGKPIPLVIEAPLTVVDVLENTGQTARAGLELEAARVYYEEVARKYPGTETEVVAGIELAKVALRQGRIDDAEALLVQAQALPAAKPYEGAILFSLGGVRVQRRESAGAAIASFRELVARFPEDTNAPSALIQIGSAMNALGNPDSALAALALVESKYPRDANAGSTARLASARVLAQAGRWTEAVRTLRSLSADYPRTNPGLLAPIEAVSYLEDSGQKEAAQLALRDAAATYERMANELAKDSAVRGALVPLALDHLAEANERLGEWQKAVDALLTRAQNFPDRDDSPFAYVRAAGLQELRLHDRAAAIRTLELLTGRYPDLPLARQAEAKIAQLRGAS